MVFFLLQAIIPSFNLGFNIIWPIALILVGVGTAAKERKIDLWNILIAFIGLWFLLLNLNIINNDYKEIFWPIIIILVGLSIFINAIKIKKNREIVKTISNNKALNYNAVFSGIEEKIITKDFKGANIYAVFGGVDLDLREIEIKDDVVINVTSIFGGTDLFLPENKYNIKVTNNSIFGGTENKNKSEHQENRKTIYINAVSVFGGTDIK